MVKAQEWLDQNYPKENRSEVREVYLNEPTLKGELDLGDFVCKYYNEYGDEYGVKIYISPCVDETKLEIKNLPEKAEIILINAERHINYHYHTKKEREKVTELNIWKRKLEGDLDLSDFTSLKRLYCSINKLSSLCVNSCFQLEKISCSDNQLNSLDINSCSSLIELDCENNFLTNITLSTNLKSLNLRNNNFLTQDLSFLTQVTNLEWLYLQNDDEEKIKKNIYNRFSGSIDCLGNMKKLKILRIDNTELNEVNIDKLPRSLESIRYSTKLRPDCTLTQIVPQLEEYEWKDIHPDFNLWHRRKWEKVGFNKEQAKEWIEVGIKPNDYNFTSYLRDVKKLTSQESLNDKEDYQKLKEKCNDFNWCHQCQQPNTSRSWCQLCWEKELKKDLNHLTGQELVEKFIQQQQLRQELIIGSQDENWMLSKNWLELIEDETLKWIPHEQFTNIEHLADGGFSKIYKAKWGECRNGNDRIVALKILNGSQDIVLNFLQEIANNSLINDLGHHIINCYGISQDPQTKNYVIVMDYKKDGNLRQYLKNNYNKLNLKDKINKLYQIVCGLNIMCGQGLIHKDFHPGNILNDREWDSSFITDLGLCQPANYQKDNSEIFGVLPYVAPEVLQGQPYTQASDIYSWGIIAYELLANTYPYYEYEELKDLDDNSFASKVYEGLRPDIDKVPIPQLLKNLIKRCWDTDPEKRPSAGKLQEITGDWRKEIKDKKNTEFSQQYQGIEEKYDHWSQNIPYQIPSKATTTSKSINTKEIAELVKKLQETKQNFPQPTKTTEQIKEIEKKLAELKKPLNSELAELVDKFVETKKKLIKDRKNKEVKTEARKLGKQLEEKGLSEKKIDEIIRYCENLIELEQQLEQEQLQTNTEIPPKK